MTSFNTELTKEDFLAFPEYAVKQDVPKDKSPFLLKNSKLLTQKDYLLDVLAQLSKANTMMLEERKNTTEVLKVIYLVRHDDGNVSERGGFIRLNKIINDLMTKAPTVDANGVLTIETA